MEKLIIVKEAILKPSVKGEYLLVTDHGAVKYSCFQEHKDLWACLDKNMSATIEYEEVGKYKNIVNATPMSGQITVDESKITEQQVVPPVAKTAPAPQELGMWWKEMGECIRRGLIDKDFPNMATKIKGQYYKQMEAVTGITMKKED